MHKYSKNIKKPAENFTVRDSTKSSYHQPKNLKVKKASIHRTIDKDAITHSSIDSMAIKSQILQPTKKVKSKTREYTNAFCQENSDNKTDNSSKTAR